MVKQALKGFWRVLEQGDAVQSGRLSRAHYKHEYEKTSKVRCRMWLESCCEMCRQALAPHMPLDLYENSMVIDWLSVRQTAVLRQADTEADRQ